MNKSTILSIALTTAVVALTGCSVVYDIMGTTPEAMHTAAVTKVTDYAENYVNKRIDESNKLTPEAKVQLKADVAKIKADIIVKIDELKKKYDEAKDVKAEKTAAAKAEVKVETAEAKK